MPRPDWSRKLPRPLKIPTVMDLVTLADARSAYHHVIQQHLKRYLAEFDFRYNERSALGVNDKALAACLLKGIVGKCLTY